MEEQAIFAQLPAALLPWFAAHQRDLPWRKDKEPYHVWVSEIMLQQTRVEAVRGYYQRFLQELPTVEALAACDDEKLHKLWEGLGYYSRVRNLKKAARVITEQYGGAFPNTYPEVLKLPGIGEYTAGAICSIAFGRRVPAVDGNVLRVCSRLLNDASPIDLPETKARVRTALTAIYPREAGAFTQALMELGATLCGPNRKPECQQCPCRDFCRAFQCGMSENLPVKSPKREKKQENRTVFVLSCGGLYAVSKRPQKGLLAGLYEFPNTPGHLSPEEALEKVREYGLIPQELFRQLERPHIFTHIRWDMRCYYLEVQETAGEFQWMSAEEIKDRAALPTAFRQFWTAMQQVEDT